MSLVAGIDVATAAVRVAVHAADGARLAEATRPLPAPVRPGDGRSEQDAASWWPAVADALAESTAALGSRAAEIRSLAVSATSGTAVLVDAAGIPLRPALMYDDRRATGVARVALLADGFEDRAARLCHTPDLLCWHLIGEPVGTDSSHALKTGYDPMRGEWARSDFDALLPPVARPTTVLGTVSAAAARRTGLPAGCEVRAGMTDGCAGQLACGAVDVGSFVTVIGTTLVIKGVSREPVHDPSGVVYSHRHPDGAWLPGGASNTGGSALSDVAPGELAKLDAAAARHGPSTVVDYPLRGTGERFPFLAPSAHGFTVGEPVDAVDTHRARLEGVAFCERLALERLASLGAPAEPPVRTAGGGARSLVWCRIRASVLGEPVCRTRRADTALGAALLAAAGSVHDDLRSAAAAMVPEPELVNPERGEIAVLDEHYQRFVDELRTRGWA
ncbi:MAG: carbohydrate kinase [Pseudonocardiaceae bacterium]|nr:carbohydrate kinase [Pseudonocardiaceae bacterium]